MSTGNTEGMGHGKVTFSLRHESIGHLIIFSGTVAKKKHARIVSMLKTIERPARTLYGMTIAETRGARRGPKFRPIQS